MASGNITQQNFRKAIGALKDSTKVGMAIVNSDYKELDVAIVKATNHDEVIPKEKHVRRIFNSLSGSSHRADVAYCIHALDRRLSKTRTWAVALKTLVVIHRGLREIDATFQQELINYNCNKGYLLNLSHFKDDSSAKAWENSSWVRCYSLYLEESLECFRAMKYDFQKDCTKTKVLDTPNLLEQLPRLQELLFRLLDCKPVGAAQHNFLIHYALSIVAAESVRLYVAITDGIVNLVDKFFEMQRHDAVRALEIYKKAGNQAEKLSEFFEICRNLEFGRGQKYVKIEQLPASFLTAMEEYIKDAPQTLALPWRANDNEELRNPEAITAGETSLHINHEPDDDMQNCSDPSVASLVAPKDDNCDTTATTPVPDLMSLDDLPQEVPIMDDPNPLALAIITPGEDQSNTLVSATSWELELVSATSSHHAAVPASTMGGGLDRMTLDNLYDVAIARTNPNETYQVAGTSSNPFEASTYSEDPFYVSSNAETHTDVQELDMTQNEDPCMQQQQQDPLPCMQQQQQDPEPFMQQQQQYSTNPFGNPFLDQGNSYPSQNQSVHAGLI